MNGRNVHSMRHSFALATNKIRKCGITNAEVTFLHHSLDKPQLISWDVLQVLYGVCPTTKLIRGIELSHHAVRGLPQSV